MPLRRRLLTAGLSGAWALSRQAAVRRFDEGSRFPGRAQAAWLKQAIKTLGPSTYGRSVGLDGCSSLSDFQRRVPTSTWDEVAPWVERLANGEPKVLSTEPVLVFERTSGSTRAPKRIPVTRGLLDDFANATGPWLDDLTRGFPRLLTTRQYWSLSPVARANEVTPSGVRVGFEDDTEYFGPATRWALKRLMAVPSSVAKAPDVDTWRHETLRALITCEDLGLLSAWNPSFLTLLLEALERDFAAYQPLLSSTQREALDRAGRLTGEALWPSLQLISCWTEGWAAQAVPGLRRFFPVTPMQGKGLLATEGVVSVPRLGQPAPVAAVTSHLLEFEALEDAGRPVKLVDSLKEGATYAPLITTRSGLVRYRLPDVVRCVGFWRALPLLRFEGRLDKTSDLRGEKLSAVVVEAALRDALQGLPVDFVLLAPSVADPPRYTLFIEATVDQARVLQVAAALEQRLVREYHYAYCRDLGQLGPVEAVQINHGLGTFQRVMQQRGLKLGDVKPSGFDPGTEWAAAFRSLP